MLYIVDLKEKLLQSPLAITPDFVVEAVIFWGTLSLMDYTIKINFTSFFLKKNTFFKSDYMKNFKLHMWLNFYFIGCCCSRVNHDLYPPFEYPVIAFYNQCTLIFIHIFTSFFVLQDFFFVSLFNFFKLILFFGCTTWYEGS